MPYLLVICLLLLPTLKCAPRLVSCSYHGKLPTQTRWATDTMNSIGQHAYTYILDISDGRIPLVVCLYPPSHQWPKTHCTIEHQHPWLIDRDSDPPSNGQHNPPCTSPPSRLISHEHPQIYIKQWLQTLCFPQHQMCSILFLKHPIHVKQQNTFIVFLGVILTAFFNSFTYSIFLLFVLILTALASHTPSFSSVLEEWSL
jgi:hypothetical protein